MTTKDDPTKEGRRARRSRRRRGPRNTAAEPALLALGPRGDPLSAAEALLARAARAAVESGAGDDAARAQQLIRATASLARAREKARAEPDELPGTEEAQRAEILAKLDEALDGGRKARALQVADLQARGIDPRLAWVWDEAREVWVWDVGAAMAGGGVETRGDSSG